MYIMAMVPNHKDMWTNLHATARLHSAVYPQYKCPVEHLCFVCVMILCVQAEAARIPALPWDSRCGQDTSTIERMYNWNQDIATGETDSAEHQHYMM